MKSSSTPVIKDLVLVGGGHSHLSVLKFFGMNPVPGLRITLITRDLHTPYSGMLPGYISGHYSYDETHIDLRPLALFANARIYHSEVSALDLDKQQVICPDRPAVDYDVLSINIGSRPSTLHIPGVEQFSCSVKPINTFLGHWQNLIQRVLNTDKNFRLAIVGAGAGGVEMALASQYRLQQELTKAGKPKDLLEHYLLTDNQQILSTHNRFVRQRFERVLQQRNIKTLTQHRVSEVFTDHLRCENGQEIATDAVLMVTNASAPVWLKNAGLDVDEQGFILVNDTLQSSSHPEVFAAGDIASVIKYPRQKSGVFAVRQGLPLAKNLHRALGNKTLKAFKPQKEFLGLISTGDQYAIASRANWSMEGAWLWRIKDWIDRRFMENFANLPSMDAPAPADYDQQLATPDVIEEMAANNLRCGGCGAKIGNSVLSKVIRQLQPKSSEQVIIGLDAPDDAAVTKVPEGKLLVQSVDYFRSFIDDPYLFGKIATHHALSDLFAMGAQPLSAMAIATIPYDLEKQVQNNLQLLMSGALEVLNDSHTVLLGGHSSEGAELSFGLSVNGTIDEDAILRKAGMQVGDAIILTKALGTGTLFAADMQRKAKGRWIDTAIQHMLMSNQAAAACLHDAGTSACTDVTGFGLLGHLAEMTQASGVEVEIDLSVIPALPGALSTMDMGIFSSLQVQNQRFDRVLAEQPQRKMPLPLLFDPQTSGGLLASIATDKAPACLAELHQLGYKQASIIGRVSARNACTQNIHLRTD